MGLHGALCVGLGVSRPSPHRVGQAAFGLVQGGDVWHWKMVALLDGGVIFHHMRREVQATLDCAAELLALNREVQSPSFSVPLAVYRGWALAQSGRVEEGIASMRQGLADFRACGDQTRVPHFLALLAEGYLAAGQAEEGLAAIAEALEVAERNDDRYYEAEIHRIRGELLLLRGADPEEVEEAYRRSIAVAQDQEAKSFELRSTISLAKLLQRAGACGRGAGDAGGDLWLVHGGVRHAGSAGGQEVVGGVIRLTRQLC